VESTSQSNKQEIDLAIATRIIYMIVAIAALLLLSYGYNQHLEYKKFVVTATAAQANYTCVEIPVTNKESLK